jgi:hypothetical protein
VWTEALDLRIDSLCDPDYLAEKLSLAADAAAFPGWQPGDLASLRDWIRDMTDMQPHSKAVGGYKRLGLCCSTSTAPRWKAARRPPAGESVAIESRCSRSCVDVVQGDQDEPGPRAGRQPFDVVTTHDVAPFGLTQGKDAPLASWFGRRKDRDVDLDLGPAGRIVHDAGTDLTRRCPERGGPCTYGEAPAEGLEVRPYDPAEETAR